MITLDIFIWIVVCIVAILVSGFFSIHWLIVVLIGVLLIAIFELVVFIIDKTVKQTQ